jgi:hypothetical protein
MSATGASKQSSMPLQRWHNAKPAVHMWRGLRTRLTGPTRRLLSSGQPGAAERTVAKVSVGFVSSQSWSAWGWVSTGQKRTRQEVGMRVRE